MSILISPHFNDEKLDSPTIDDLIDVLDDRIRFWIFEPAKKLLQEDNGKVAAFCLLLTYFEGIWIYITGQNSKDTSLQFFREAFVDVFRNGGTSLDLLLRVGDILYKDARCGFFHDSMFRERILFAEMNHDIVITLPKKKGQIDETGMIQSILIDPRRCFIAVEKHFTNFVNMLRDDTNIQRRILFQKICREKWNWEQEGPVIGMPDPNETCI